MSAAISALLGIVTIYLSSLRIARKASKVSPINSIRNSADIKIWKETKRDTESQ